MEFIDKYLNESKKIIDLLDRNQIEKIVMVVIITDTAMPFTFHNGLLTNSHKLKRLEIKQAYLKELEDAYTK